MKIIDIQNSITKILHSNFLTYKIVLEQQCDVIKPTFFVNVKKLSSTNFLNYKEKLVNVTITYVNKEYNHIENNEINDKLDNLFKLKLQVGDRYLNIFNLNFNEPDALICSFNLKFNENIKEKEEYEKMQELVFKS